MNHRFKFDSSRRKLKEMITKMSLEQCRSLKINDVGIEDLQDIRNVQINPNKPVMERLMSFMLQIKNPYLFKVDGTPVKVEFTSNGPTLQKSLESILTKNS